MNAKREVKKNFGNIGEWLDIMEDDRHRGDGRGNESCHEIKTNPKVKERRTRRRQ